MSNYSIWLLEYGRVDRYPASNLFAGEAFAGVRSLSFCFGLVRSTDRNILVDTGFRDERKQRELLDKYGPARWQTPAEIVRRAGLDPREVDTLILTHNDFDHAGCVQDFPNARVYIQREEMVRYSLAAALPARFAFLTKHTQNDLPATLDERAVRGLLTLLDEEADIADGISVVPAFGTHTAGSQYVVVDNPADGRWIFPGDIVYVYENIEGIRHDGVLAPIGLSTGSPTTWLTAAAGIVDMLAGDTRRVLPFHDVRVWDRYRSRAYDDGLHVAEISLAGGHDSVV
jgi:N-acyl homoserine lactone hydrolase